MRPSKKGLPSTNEQALSKQENMNAKHVNEYIEYCNLVGDNGGLVMS